MWLRIAPSAAPYFCVHGKGMCLIVPSSGDRPEDRCEASNKMFSEVATRELKIAKKTLVGLPQSRFPFPVIMKLFDFYVILGK